MKVNINLEIDDAQRNVLARIIDGKDIKRLATRDEVRDYVASCIASLVEARKIADTEPAVAEVHPPKRASTGDLMRIDPEDEEYLRGKEPGFIMGWNRWKRRNQK